MLQISLTNQSSALLPLLEIYPNKRNAKILQDGISEGFRLGYMGKGESRESHNLKSVTHLQDKVMEKLNKKIEFIVSPSAQG